jgi:hypothetical protein
LKVFITIETVDTIDACTRTENSTVVRVGDGAVLRCCQQRAIILKEHGSRIYTRPLTKSVALEVGERKKID